MKSGDKMDKQRVTLRIFNDEYQIRTDIPEEKLIGLANIVDEKMINIASNQSALTPSKIAVLAALELASELDELKKSYAGLVKVIKDK